MDDRVIERRDGISLARNFRCDSLINLRRQAWVDENRSLRLTEHVDESWSNNSPGSVDGSFTWRRGEVADGGDFAIADAEVCGVPGRACAIDDVAVGDDEIK